MTKILDLTYHHKDAAEVGSKLAQRLLEAPEPFCLWLKGEMGSGKTTLTRHILYALGLDKQYPVVSPTYTLMQDYNTHLGRFAHLDLYRLDQQANIEELGILDTYSWRGVFIEWPHCLDQVSDLHATHLLEFQQGSEESEQCRKIQLSLI